MPTQPITRPVSVGEVESLLRRSHERPAASREAPTLTAARLALWAPRPMGLARAASRPPAAQEQREPGPGLSKGRF